MGLWISSRTTTLTRLPRESFHFKNPSSATRVQRFVLPLVFGCGLSVVCKLLNQYIKFGIAVSRFHAPWRIGFDSCKLPTLYVMPLLDYLTRDDTRLRVGCLFIKIEKGYYRDFPRQPSLPAREGVDIRPTRMNRSCSRDLNASAGKLKSPLVTTPQFSFEAERPQSPGRMTLQSESGPSPTRCIALCTPVMGVSLWG